METVTLQFQSVKELWEFRLAIEAYVFEINLRDRTLTCNCTRDHLKLAIEQYGARLVNNDPEKANA